MQIHLNFHLIIFLPRLKNVFIKFSDRALLENLQNSYDKKMELSGVQPTSVESSRQTKKKTNMEKKQLAKKQKIAAKQLKLAKGKTTSKSCEEIKELSNPWEHKEPKISSPKISSGESTYMVPKIPEIPSESFGSLFLETHMILDSVFQVRIIILYDTCTLLAPRINHFPCT